MPMRLRNGYPATDVKRCTPPVEIQRTRQPANVVALRLEKIWVPEPLHTSTRSRNLVPIARESAAAQQIE